MATIVTARRASQALDGQSVVIQLDATDSAKLADLTIGQRGTLSSNSKEGHICSIDEFGHSFKMNPEQLNQNLASASTPGYLANSEIITLD